MGLELAVQKVYWGIRPAGRKRRNWDWVGEPSDQDADPTKPLSSTGSSRSKTVFAEVGLKELIAGGCQQTILLTAGHRVSLEGVSEHCTFLCSYTPQHL